MKKILSYSTEIERELARSNAHLTEALQELGALEEITRDSIFATTDAPPKTRPATPAVSPPEISVRYQTSKAEYRPALANQTLIDALLEFHQGAQRRKSPRSQAEGPRSFSQTELLAVEAEPKSESIGRARPESSFPILRSKAPKD